MSDIDDDVDAVTDSSNDEQPLKLTKRKQRQLDLRAAKAKRGGGLIETPELIDIQENSTVGLCAPIKSVVTVAYCPTCGFPPDFCEFSPNWDACRERALTEYRQYYRHICPDSPLQEGPAKDRSSPLTPHTNNGDSKTNEAAKQVDKTKKGKKGDAKHQVTIQRVTRAKHKVATVITGLDSFGVQLDASAKIFKKRFACGSSAVKGVSGQNDHVEIQGDFEDVILEVILQHYPQVPEDAIVRLKPK